MDYRDYLKQNNDGRLHFWFRAKNNLIAELMSGLYDGRGANRSILDVGSGTGTELAILRQFGAVTAFDKNADALELAAKTGCTTIAGDLERDGLPAGAYDCIGCFDVFEHLADDRGALDSVYRSLKPGGRLIFTVPAYPMLFGPHDIALGHKRRYRKKEFERKLKTAGFTGVKAGYWNTLLFPPEAIFRIAKKFLSEYGKNKEYHSEAVVPPRPLNDLLFRILNFENKMIGRGYGLPFGLTIYGTAKK